MNIYNITIQLINVSKLINYVLNKYTNMNEHANMNEWTISQTNLTGMHKST